MTYRKNGVYTITSIDGNWPASTTIATVRHRRHRAFSKKTRRHCSPLDRDVTLCLDALVDNKCPQKRTFSKHFNVCALTVLCTYIKVKTWLEGQSPINLERNRHDERSSDDVPG
jgi:hypothetical protein